MIDLYLDLYSVMSLLSLCLVDMAPLLVCIVGSPKPSEHPPLECGQAQAHPTDGKKVDSEHPSSLLSHLHIECTAPTHDTLVNPSFPTCLHVPPLT